MEKRAQTNQPRIIEPRELRRWIPLRPSGRAAVLHLPPPPRAQLHRPLPTPSIRTSLLVGKGTRCVLVCGLCCVVLLGFWALGLTVVVVFLPCVVFFCAVPSVWSLVASRCTVVYGRALSLSLAVRIFGGRVERCGRLSRIQHLMTIISQHNTSLPLPFITLKTTTTTTVDSRWRTLWQITRSSTSSVC